MNLLNESLSMNVFQMRGMTFIPDKEKTDLDRESDTKTYSRVELSRCNFKMGDTLTLHNYVNDSYV
jgi:hypothetical protein